MIHRRTLMAAAAVVIAASGGVCAASASSREEPTPPLFGTNRTYVEPTTTALADGNYLGLIRALSADGEIVAVDFVSHTGPVVGNDRPEQLVDAGVLGTSSFFAPVPTAFRLRIERNVIVAVQSADDELEGPSEPPAELPWTGAARADEISHSADQDQPDVVIDDISPRLR
jgi:hypothetical protein